MRIIGANKTEILISWEVGNFQTSPSSALKHETSFEDIKRERGDGVFA